ncbi:Hypothetical predicted protein, partial [Pelobates cultripes]
MSSDVVFHLYLRSRPCHFFSTLKRILENLVRNKSKGEPFRTDTKSCLQNNYNMGQQASDALSSDNYIPPPGEPGQPFDGLWDYEVVESFFLNSKTTQYLEVELCPHGQHLVLLLCGVGNAFK